MKLIDNKELVVEREVKRLREFKAILAAGAKTHIQRRTG